MDISNQTQQAHGKNSDTAASASEARPTQLLRSPQVNAPPPRESARTLSSQRKKSYSVGGAGGRRSSTREASTATIAKIRPQKLKHIFQNSYRLEPVVRFNPDHARAIIEKVLLEKFDGRKFPAIVHPELVQRASIEIREKVKDMMVERYKLVCVVMIGQKVDCSITVASQCLSDFNVDTFASYTYENMEMFVTAIVYAFYFE